MNSPMGMRKLFSQFECTSSIVKEEKQWVEKRKRERKDIKCLVQGADIVGENVGF